MIEAPENPVEALLDELLHPIHMTQVRGNWTTETTIPIDEQYGMTVLARAVMFLQIDNAALRGDLTDLKGDIQELQAYLRTESSPF